MMTDVPQEVGDDRTIHLAEKKYSEGIGEIIFKVTSYQGHSVWLYPEDVRMLYDWLEGVSGD